MVRFAASLLLCLLLSKPAWATSFNASVDRKTISEQGSFTLILRYGAQAGFGSPDVSALQKDFHILNQQQSRKMSTVNGKTESYTDWVLTLTPKRTGSAVIPAIEYDGEKTEPITIDVRPVSEEVKAQQEKEFFFDIQVQEQSDYYVQQQILYSEKIYYSVAHDDASLTPLEVTDARVEALGDVRQYTTVIKGQRFGVYERHYAIYPEVSGELVIPGQRFQATVRDPYDRWGRGRQASLVSKPIKLMVKSIPDSYPQAPWLPASELTVQETFSTRPADWHQGEPVTRTITLVAKGLPGTQLPAVPVPDIAGVRYYPDQTDASDKVTDSGVEGTSVQSMALVPTASGELSLPEVRIPWWNTRKGQLEYAVLPAHTFDVAAAPGSQPQATAATDRSSEATATTTTTGQSSGRFSGLWPILFALSLLANILLIWLLLRKRNNAEQSDIKADNVSERQRWKALAEACRHGDPASIHAALLDWANAAQLQPQPITSLPQLAAVYQDAALQSALAELDALLFSGQGNSVYNAQNLLALLKSRQALQDGHQAQQSLYPL